MFRWTLPPASRRTGFIIPVKGGNGNPRKGGNKRLFNTNGGNPYIGWNGKGLGYFPVFDIQLHQRFGVFGNKGDGHHHHHNPIVAGASKFIIQGGADPFKPPNPALETHHPIQALNRQRTYQCLGGRQG